MSRAYTLSKSFLLLPQPSLVSYDYELLIIKIKNYLRSLTNINIPINDPAKKDMQNLMYILHECISLQFSELQLKQKHHCSTYLKEVLEGIYIITG